MYCVYQECIPLMVGNIQFLSMHSVPSAPLEVRAINVGSIGFTLEWNPPSSPNGIIDFYQVELFAENNLDLPALNPVNVSSTSYNFTGLAPFTEYSVQVCAYTTECGDIATLKVTTLRGKKGQLSLLWINSTRPVTSICTPYIRTPCMCVMVNGGIVLVAYITKQLQSKYIQCNLQNTIEM